MSGISVESVIDGLYSWRRDKLALTALLGFMGGDSATEAWVRLDEILPTLKDLATQSRKGAKSRIAIDHDIAARVASIAEEIEPWLRQIAEMETV